LRRLLNRRHAHERRFMFELLAPMTNERAGEQFATRYAEWIRIFS
jgi:hypothetical protein